MSKQLAMQKLLEDYKYRTDVMTGIFRRYLQDGDIPLDERWEEFCNSGLGSKSYGVPAYNVFNIFRGRFAENYLMNLVITSLRNRGLIQFASWFQIVRDLETRYVGAIIPATNMSNGQPFTVTHDFINGVKNEVLQRYSTGFYLAQ